jgi:hypothetical protein
MVSIELRTDFLAAITFPSAQLPSFAFQRKFHALLPVAINFAGFKVLVKFGVSGHQNIPSLLSTITTISEIMPTF